MGTVELTLEQWIEIALRYARATPRGAIDRTRTHVGAAELTLEQWIEIALRNASEPRREAR